MNKELDEMARAYELEPSLETYLRLYAAECRVWAPGFGRLQRERYEVRFHFPNLRTTPLVPDPFTRQSVAWPLYCVQEVPANVGVISGMSLLYYAPWRIYLTYKQITAPVQVESPQPIRKILVYCSDGQIGSFGPIPDSNYQFPWLYESIQSFNEKYWR